MNLAKFFNHDFDNGDFRLCNKNGNIVYFEASNAYWGKSIFDKNNNEIYYESSNDYWRKREFDENDNMVYYEYSDGYWCKIEFNENNRMIYSENSIDGIVFDNRPKQSYNDKVIEIDGVKYRLQEI